MKRKLDTPQSVARRVLAILGEFDKHRSALTMTEISVRTGLPMSTTSRLLAELTQGGALVRDERLRYRLAHRVL